MPQNISLTPQLQPNEMPPALQLPSANAMPPSIITRTNLVARSSFLPHWTRPPQTH